MLGSVLKQFGFNENDCTIQPYGSGLINSTWLIGHDQKQFILQRVNHDIFLHPEDIAFNTRLIGNYLSENYPGYLFVHPCAGVNGEDMIKIWDSYFRMFPFVKDSHTIDTVQTPEQAFEAARQFAIFTRSLSGLDATKLKITIPDFHNLYLRYEQFENACRTGNKSRISEAKELIELVKQNKPIVDEYESCKKELRLRCTHHDTKISNVLFDQTGKGLCVIDLDTVMPGYFISDVGDMMRTYLCPVSEEETDLSKITVRKEFYDAVVNGYLSEMGEELAENEKRFFHFAGIFMIYMQAIRFLNDHLTDDTYYGAEYEGHNFIRAGNQLALLRELQLLK
jgi:Ser/Thr protein kinase RdoA (MazF antagonist)